MTFHSILYEKGHDRLRMGSQKAPEYFHDLGLGHIIDRVTSGRDEYGLKSFFYDRLDAVEMIEYRQQIMQELECTRVSECIERFADGMSLMRQSLKRVEEIYYKHQKDRWFLQAAAVYCMVVRRLSQDLASISLSSRGLIAFRAFLVTYIDSSNFISLSNDTEALTDRLAKVRYSILIKGSSFKVREYDSEVDYSTEISQLFEKFQQEDCKDYRIKFNNPPQVNHVEAKILDFVAKLNPDVFLTLNEFCLKRADYLDPTILTFDREVQFYMSYLEHMIRLRQQGLKFCYPMVTSIDKDVRNDNAFDLALAERLVTCNQPVVCNDLCLTGPERILVISGPNQGGKTTFARAFGQLHHLANIGLPVPGQNARLFLFDQMFTHFEREENLDNLSGKLQDDLLRVHDILTRATSRSIIILNEIFSSTTSKDASFLARKIIDRIVELDALCVCVTFLDEFASLNEKTVSMLSVVEPDNPAVRTYKVIRRAADGQAYAVSIAEKHGLTYRCLSQRVSF